MKTGFDLVVFIGAGSPHRGDLAFEPAELPFGFDQPNICVPAVPVAAISPASALPAIAVAPIVVGYPFRPRRP
jgi:hypothetical protein